MVQFRVQRTLKPRSMASSRSIRRRHDRTNGLGCQGPGDRGALPRARTNRPEWLPMCRAALRRSKPSTWSRQRPSGRPQGRSRSPIPPAASAGSATSSSRQPGGGLRGGRCNATAGSTRAAPPQTVYSPGPYRHTRILISRATIDAGGAGNCSNLTLGRRSGNAGTSLTTRARQAPPRPDDWCERRAVSGSRPTAATPPVDCWPSGSVPERRPAGASSVPRASGVRPAAAAAEPGLLRSRLVQHRVGLCEFFRCIAPQPGGLACQVQHKPHAPPAGLRLRSGTPNPLPLPLSEHTLHLQDERSVRVSTRPVPSCPFNDPGAPDGCCSITGSRPIMEPVDRGSMPEVRSHPAAT